jgi:hypothetical protein
MLGPENGFQGGTMTTERSQYLAYLLRLWQVGSGQESTWRASLEDAHTGERYGFTDLKALFRFLESEIGPEAPAREAPGKDGRGGDA